MTDGELREYVRRVVDAAPPLSAAQRECLALLLAPAGAGLAAEVAVHAAA